MDSREKILMAIKVNKPDVLPLPELPTFETSEGDRVARFMDKLKEIDCSVVVKEDQTLEQVTRQYYPEADRIFSPADLSLGNISTENIIYPQDLLPLDLTILDGQLGVAESGAIWVTETEMVHRVTPFLTEHLVLLLDRKDIVENMHQAYEKIKVDETGFGVFIAGPSKTADIEQSLVVGAQAARSLLVVIM